MTQTPMAIRATTPQLLKATAAALAAATVLLFTAVLPAEYGFDPTGVGTALGLTALHEPESPPVAPASESLPTASASVAAAASPADSAIRQGVPFRSGEMSLTLQPNEGAEIKAQMRSRESFVFSWATDGGPVNFDMHGEKPNAGDEFSSYWKDRARTEGHGSFVAPFDGSHGWYFKNVGTAPVTVTVRLSGYFEKLYRP